MKKISIILATIVAAFTYQSCTKKAVEADPMLTVAYSTSGANVDTFTAVNDTMITVSSKPISFNIDSISKIAGTKATYALSDAKLKNVKLEILGGDNHEYLPEEKYDLDILMGGTTIFSDTALNATNVYNYTPATPSAAKAIIDANNLVLKSVLHYKAGTFVDVSKHNFTFTTDLYFK